MVSESLLDTGVSETGKAYADILCLEITRGLTGQDLFIFASDILLPEDFQKLRPFCVAHYPLLFAAIDAHLGNRVQCISPSSHSLSGILLLLVFFAAPCCAGYLKITSKAVSQADYGQERCKKLGDWCAQRWSVTSRTLCSQSVPETISRPWQRLTTQRFMPNDCFQDHRWVSLSAKKQHRVQIESRQLVFRQIYDMVQGHILYHLQVWHRLSSELTRDQDSRSSIGFLMTAEDRLWWNDLYDLKRRGSRISRRS